MKLKYLSWLGWIPSLWYLLFLIFPLAFVLTYSFLTRGVYGTVEWEFTLSNYVKLLQPIYFLIFWDSFKLALLTSFVCLILGFPMAWAMASMSNKWRNICLVLIAIPFLTNLIGRVYALRLFTSFEGPLVGWLQNLGLDVNPYGFTHNYYMVVYGMVANYLPFMVLPLYSSMEKFDFSLLEAAYDLGASHWQAMTQVLIPVSKNSIATGVVMVFIPSLGEFVIPDLLGGAKNMMVGNLITEQFLKARDWPFGSAVSVFLIMVLCLAVLLGFVWKPRKEHGKN
jgi:spermidine/putrescine transport system permease protein